MRIDHASFVPAGPAAVWRLLSDVEGSQGCPPTIRSVSAPEGPGLAVGRRFAIRQPLLRQAIWRVAALEPGRAFRLGVAGFSADHGLTPVQGGCLIRLDLSPRGRVRAAWPLLRPVLRLALAMEARGLRRACAGERA